MASITLTSLTLIAMLCNPVSILIMLILAFFWHPSMICIDSFWMVSTYRSFLDSLWKVVVLHYAPDLLLYWCRLASADTLAPIQQHASDLSGRSLALHCVSTRFTSASLFKAVNPLYIPRHSYVDSFSTGVSYRVSYYHFAYSETSPSVWVKLVNMSSIFL